MSAKLLSLSVLALLSLTSAAPSPKHQPHVADGLDQLSKAAGKVYFGTAADIPGTGELNDPYYMAQFNNSADFGQATPANAQKWQFTEPEQGVFDYTDADKFVAVAKASGKLIRCHNIVWHNQLPAFVTNGNWTKESLLAVVDARARALVTHFGNSCYAWDVVNEALNDDGTYRESVFYNVTGTDYISTAFKAAQETVHKLKLKTKLYYNDYNIENPGAKSTAAAGIVKLLQSQHIKIDGVGLQSHFIVGETPSFAQQTQNMASFTSLGVDVAITELDIRTTTPPTDAAKAQQVVDYNTTVSACTVTKRCIGVTLWDFDDDYSWIPSTFAGQGYGDVWYGSNGTGTPLIRKIAYGGIQTGLKVKKLAGY